MQHKALKSNNTGDNDAAAKEIADVQSKLNKSEQKNAKLSNKVNTLKKTKEDLTSKLAESKKNTTK